VSTDREGLGTLSLKWAHRIVSGATPAVPDVGGYGQVIVPALQDEATGCWRGLDQALALPGHEGRRMRVVITWDSHADAPALDAQTFPDRRKSDLDLVLLDPQGTVLTGARGSGYGVYASNTEWIDLVVPAEGTYTLHVAVSRWDCDLTDETVGFAWLAAPGSAGSGAR
jgi:hypothetical protein